MNSSQSTRIDEVVRERSLKNGLTQMIWCATMLGCGEGNFSIFAAHVGAPEYYFGLLTGVPNLIGPLTQVAGANVLDSTKARKRIVLLGVVTQAITFLPLALVALLGSQSVARMTFLPLAMCYYVSGHFASPAWSSWIGVLTTSATRGHYFAKLYRLMSFVVLLTKLATIAAMYAASLAPDLESRVRWITLVFVASFAIALGARLLSFRSLSKMYDPAYEHSEEAQFTFWQFVRRAPESNFVKFSFFVSLFYFGAYISAPFFVPYALETLHFHQWQWVVMDSGQTLAAVLSFVFWGHFGARFGNKRTMVYSSILISTIPMLWMCTDNFILLTITQTVAGAVWAGFNLAVTNYIMEAVTPAKRARCWAYCNIFIGFGMFSGSMAGTVMEHCLPLRFAIAGHSFDVKSTVVYLFLASGLIRLITAIFLLPIVRELREVQSFSLAQWAFQITGLRPQEGTRFGPVAEKSTGDDEPPPPVEPKPSTPKVEESKTQ